MGAANELAEGTSRASRPSRLGRKHRGPRLARVGVRRAAKRPRMCHIESNSSFLFGRLLYRQPNCRTVERHPVNCPVLTSHNGDWESGMGEVRYSGGAWQTRCREEAEGGDFGGMVGFSPKGI